MSSPQKIQAKFGLLRPFLKGRLRRLWAAAEAIEIGPGGARRVAASTGLSVATIKLGMRELRATTEVQVEAQDNKTEEHKAPTRGPGRLWSEEKNPALIPALERLLADEVAGDPMGEQKWVRSSFRRLSERLNQQGHEVSYKTVGRLLKKMGFSLKCNKRKQPRRDCPDQDDQFRYIASQVPGRRITYLTPFVGCRLALISRERPHACIIVRTSWSSLRSCPGRSLAATAPAV
jgi:transposase